MRTLFAAWALAVAAAGCRGRGDERREPAPAARPAAAPAPASSAAPEAPQVAPAPERADRLVVLAGGDVNLGRGAGQKILEDPLYDPFHAVRPWLEAADVVFVNLESQLSDQNGETQSPHRRLVFTGPPGGADVLARAGIDLVSTANNHAWDYGKKAMLETIANLERAGVGWAGTAREWGQAYRPAVVRAKGWSVALFAVTDIWNQGPLERHAARDWVAAARFDRLEKRIARARDEHDVVLLSYHGGGEYVDVPMGWTRSFVAAAMRSKLDALLGHHPHVPHGIGWFGGRPAFYSLGNLVFPMHSDHPMTGIGFFARLTFHGDGRLETEACPYHILGHTPLPFAGKPRAAQQRMFTSRLRLLSMATGGTEVGEPGPDGCIPVGPRPRRASGGSTRGAAAPARRGS
jgi:poly-gamma-glutamate synthesis protein (capsule biosynthesis protein)